MPCSFKKKFPKIGNENNLDSDKMAAPQMVDIRQLNPQQLTEVSQRMDQELAVLQGKDILELRYLISVGLWSLKNGCFRIKILIILSTGCHNELMSVRKKFITAREAVNDMKGNNGQPLMVPLTGSLYVRGKLSDNEKYIVGMYIFYLLLEYKTDNAFIDIGTNYYVEKNQQEAVDFFDRKLKYVEENMDKVAPQVQQKQNSKMMVERELVEKMKAAKMVKPK